MKLPTYAQHRRFCEVDGWQDKDATSGKPTGDHHRYIKLLPNGETLFTRVSHGAGEYRSKSFWADFLRTQLKVTAEEFWAAVNEGKVPDRAWAAGAKPPIGGEPMPMALVTSLRYVAGYSIDEIAAMIPAEAEVAWQQWQEANQ